ncbi:MAG: hypothetical protein AAGD05_07555 [Bacteroidota bacterium]
MNQSSTFKILLLALVINFTAAQGVLAVETTIVGNGRLLSSINSHRILSGHEIKVNGVDEIVRARITCFTRNTIAICKVKPWVVVNFTQRRKTNEVTELLAAIDILLISVFNQTKANVHARGSFHNSSKGGVLQDGKYYVCSASPIAGTTHIPQLECLKGASFSSLLGGNAQLISQCNTT